jgi:hypothetical protein
MDTPELTAIIACDLYKSGKAVDILEIFLMLLHHPKHIFPGGICIYRMTMEFSEETKKDILAACLMLLAVSLIKNIKEESGF